MVSPFLWVWLLHAVIIGPALIYISWAMLNGKPVARWWWNMLLFIGISATAYHGYKAVRSLL
jgi:hypothetical protein